MFTYNICYQIIIIVTIMKLGVSAVDLVQKEKTFIKMAEGCRVSHGATEQDVIDVNSLIAPTTRIGRCFNRCIIDMFGLIENEKLSIKPFMALARMINGKNNKEMLDASRIIAERCSDITHPDRCELGILIMQCVGKGAEDLGIDRRYYG